MITSLNLLDSIISDFISDIGSATFEEICSMIHTFQFKNNTFYRRFCQQKGVTETIDSVSAIPIIEIDSFKGQLIPSVDYLSTCEGMFLETSGTLNGKRSRIFRDSGYYKLQNLAIRKQGETNWFRRFPNKVTIICLDKANRRGLDGFKEEYSVLNTIVNYFGNSNSRFYDHRKDFYDLIDNICAAALKRLPLVLIGPSYYYSDILFRLRQEKITIPSNDHLFIMDSGGLKNRSGHECYSKYLEDLFRVFKLHHTNYKNTYAMTELGSQIPDDDNGYKIVPKWAHVRLMNEMGNIDNERGKIVILDLLNRATVFCIKTNDNAYFENGNLIITGKEL